MFWLPSKHKAGEQFTEADVNKVGPDGRTPLAEATRTSNLEMVRMLVDSNADIELASPGMKNATPLTVAVISRSQEVLKYLIGVSISVLYNYVLIYSSYFLHF